MGSLVLAMRVLLAGVFATAGAAKLADAAGSRRSLEQFGVPKRFVAIAAVVLPLAEIATAIALIPTPTARLAALSALVLLVAFIAGISNALAKGQAPDCHCFGQLHSAPAGRSTLLRNMLLAGAALVIITDGPGPAMDSWVSERTGAELVAATLGAAALGLAGAAYRYWNEARRLSRDLTDARAELALLPPGLPVGATAPQFTLPDLHGQPRTLESMVNKGRPVALIFVSPDCGTCGQLLPDLAQWQTLLADRLTVAVISRGTAADNAALADHDIDDVLLQDDWEISKAYRVGVTPTAVVVGPDWRITSSPAEGLVAIEPLVRLTLRRSGNGSATSLAAQHPTV